MKKKEKIEKIEETEINAIEEVPSEEQMRGEKRVFKIMAFVIIGCVVMFLSYLWLMNSMNKFDVGGTTFEIDKTAIVGKTLYKTSLPVYGTGGITGKVVTGEYNFYLRNDPRQLEENIPFYGALKLKKMVIVDSTRADGFMCGGDGIIGMANLLNLYKVIGTNVTKDENASCDSLGRYGIINLREGNETYIDRYGPACYNLYIKDCEVLKVMERFMLEMLIDTNKKVRQ